MHDGAVSPLGPEHFFVGLKQGWECAAFSSRVEHELASASAKAGFLHSAAEPLLHAEVFEAYPGPAEDGFSQGVCTRMFLDPKQDSVRVFLRGCFLSGPSA